MKLPLCDCGTDVHPGEDQCAGCLGVIYSFDELYEAGAFDGVLNYSDKEWLKGVFPQLDPLDLYQLQTKTSLTTAVELRNEVANWMRGMLLKEALADRV